MKTGFIYPSAFILKLVGQVGLEPTILRLKGECFKPTKLLTEIKFGSGTET